MVLNDIIKVARFHITENRGIKFELRQGVTETFRLSRERIRTVVAF